MKNWEKYEKEIKRFGLIAKVDDDIYSCAETDCIMCDFHTDALGSHILGRQCWLNLVNWLYEEYEEPKPILTLKEKHFLECLGGNRYYLARDEDDYLMMFNTKPFKEQYDWDYNDCCGSCLEINKEILKFIKWEDEEPWSVEDLLKLEVDNGDD